MCPYVSIRWEEEKEEFKEFQYNSKELESELEVQLELLEKGNAELQAKLERITMDNESSNVSWISYLFIIQKNITYFLINHSFSQEKHDALVSRLNRQVTSLQEEVNNLKTEAAQRKDYIRQLEQANDDLERSNRNALASVEDIEDRLNQVLEKNALLEVELYEKEELDVYVQRLKDEVRELNQELNHRSRASITPEKSILPQIPVEQTIRGKI